ncbi:MAG: hypothetical protein AAFR96_10230 [Planctomycetota bacterium]
MHEAPTPDRFDELSTQANTRSDPDAMHALWDAAFELQTWFVVGKAQTTAQGDAFGPLIADIDGEAFAAAFTDRERAERFLADQPDQADIVELPMVDAVELLADLALANAAAGVIFNDGNAPFLARIADLPALLAAHAPGYS